ncbi:hypothetical protein XAB3213_4440003 [Xanthomonas citri pv. bilvae]|nr:hypothetical protein XAB3213_4440003 [Xanthomonas citri pv. bilvae]
MIQKLQNGTYSLQSINQLKNTRLTLY